MKNLQAFCNKIDQIRPINTVTQARIPIFLPYKCLSKKKASQDIKIENAWGEAIIKKCRLTQSHRNLLDCIFAYSEQLRYFEQTDTLLALFDLQTIQKRLGISPTHHNWIKQKLIDMRETSIIIRTRKETIHTSIVLKFKYSQIPIPGTKSFYFYVLFDNDYLKFFCEDIWMCYRTILKEILQIKSPVVQSLIRFMISHNKPHTVKLLTLLRSIGAIRDDMSAKQISRKIHEILNHQAELSEKFKIYLSSTSKPSETTVSFDNKHLHNVVTINPAKLKK